MAGYRPRFHPRAAEAVRHLAPQAKRSIRAALDLLSHDPDAGEPLKRELDGLWKYRVKRLRIVYQPDRANRILRVLAVGHRRTIYEELADMVRSGR